LLIVAFVAVLLYSALNVALAMSQTQCPTCKGTGKVVCPDCNGTGVITVGGGGLCPTCLGTGEVTPTITFKSMHAQPSQGDIVVQAQFQNDENVTAYGKVTAEVSVGSTTYNGTTMRTSFPPHEEREVTVDIKGIPAADYKYLVQTVVVGGETEERLMVSPHVWLSEVENIVCPYCNGTGTGAATAECPTCHGTGIIDCPTCGGSGILGGGQNGNLNIPFDIGGAVVGVVVVAGVVITAFVVVKKRKVSEKDLRKLSSSEFQSWVLKKLAGKSSSAGDANVGIDGYTVDGQPISIKQADGVDRNVIEGFAAAMGRSRAKNGMIVAFSFGGDALRGKVRAKLSYGLEIQMLTLKDLMEGRTSAL
jgi:hypothetical protein